MSLIGLVVSLLAASSALADDGQPVAIRHWEGDEITIETMWGFHVGLGLTELNQSKLPRKPDLVLADVVVGQAATLQRLPNQAEFAISENPPAEGDGNAVVVKRGENGSPSTVIVDGLIIVYFDRVDDLNAAVDLKGKELVLIATDAAFEQSQYEKLATDLKPRLMIVKNGVDKIGDQTVELITHNTVAVSSGKPADLKTRIVSLGTDGYQLSKELATLFAKKEAACKKSRSVFTKLSVAQLNFKPANGTHTPRWNTEHMMGRELQFFSQIYHAVDPEIPVMNLNPAQMPNKYKFAHKDWTGEEEARQTERVEAFTRRFAYLLDGMSLNKRAKGSRFWTPKSLLAQMERHYKEHTGNVVEKMKLDGWPRE